MLMRRNQSTSKEKYWREIITEWKSSGMSINDYCRKRGLKGVTFYYWRRELRKRDQQACHGIVKTSAKVIEVPFTEVRLKGWEPPGIEVIISDARRIVVHPGFDTESFIRVIRLLEGSSC